MRWKNLGKFHENQTKNVGFIALTRKRLTVGRTDGQTDHGNHAMIKALLDFS